ncbi:MAG: hypothetical protein AVDCRST_MAG77-783 [uncultured Chloroflexi bacterium]|uniref:Uncharacterized protein n=1 Tax=uncultured Chloroflexota bacterium TaxID=166587 RepID=A0A6J4HFE9_9CHLR|nr:MAG: hypothetical protein AVDCRST_MAG77-783 [uncultured Chloroflexota bacterium]
MDLERAQQKAAELILDDEGWRDGIEDSLATPLLEWTLAQIDGRLAGAAESGALDEDLPYAVADEARAMLRGVCDTLRGFTQSHAATDAGDSVAGDGAACEPEAQG